VPDYEVPEPMLNSQYEELAEHWIAVAATVGGPDEAV